MIRAKPSYDARKPEQLHQRHMEYNIVFNTPEGKRVIEDLLYFAAIDRTAYCGKSETQTHFNLGKQSMGYHIVAAITEPFIQQQPIDKEGNND